MKLCYDSKKKQRREKMNTLSKLMHKEFCMMVINHQHLFTSSNIEIPDGCLKEIKKNPLLSLKHYIKKGCVVVLEVDHQRCFVFTHLSKSIIFKDFQRMFKDVTNYVFKGNATGGYFKILENGRVKRKIASFLKIDSTVEYPDVLGEPCELELAKNHIYKINWKATYMKDQLEPFTYQEILELFHYYIGDETTMQVNKIILYSLKWKKVVYVEEKGSI